MEVYNQVRDGVFKIAYDYYGNPVDNFVFAVSKSHFTVVDTSNVGWPKVTVESYHWFLNKEDAYEFADNKGEFIDFYTN